MKRVSIGERQEETRNVFLISTFPQDVLFSCELKGLFSLSALCLSESALVSKASISSETNHKITTWLFCWLLALLPFISPEEFGAKKPESNKSANKSAKKRIMQLMRDCLDLQHPLMIGN